MNKPILPIVPLRSMVDGQEADVFALLSEKEAHTTKDGKPYFKVAFRDAQREVKFPIWSDLPLFEDCKENWEKGRFYKLRAVYRVGNFGPQLEIRRIRLAVEADKQDGFDPMQCRVASSFPPEALYEELLAIAAKNLGKGPLLNLITRIFKDHREKLLETAAARWNHHAFAGGLLEHTLSVTRIAVALCDHYESMYPEKKGMFSRVLVVAGAILHDIGKVNEMVSDAVHSYHSTEGDLIGHIVLGRDLVRDYGREVRLDPKLQLQLEHIVLTHQRLAEWGSPKPPMSMEAVIVHHADSLDALLGVHENILRGDDAPGEMTVKKNLLGYPIYKGNKPG